MTFRVRMVFLSLFILVLFVVSDIRNASAVVDPLSGYIVASALFHAVVIGGAVAYKYFKRENGGTQPTSSHKVNSSTGTIGREATVAWVNLNDDNTVNTNAKNVSAKVLFADLKNTVSTQQSKYPNLNNALSTVGYVDVATKALSGNPVGQTFMYGPNYYYISSWLSGGSTSGAGDFGPNKMYTWNSTTKRLSIHTDWNGTYFRRLDTYQCVQTTTVPPPVPSSGSDFANNIKNSSDNTVQSVFRGEIDELIQSNPNIVHYADTTDAGAVDSSSDFVGPPTPSAYDLASAAARTAAAEATRNAWLNYSSNKGDLTARQIWLNRVAQDAKDAAVDEQSSIAPGSSPSAYGDGSAFDFQSRFSQFFTDVKATTLFSLPNKIVSSLPSGGSPVVSISCGRWGVRTVDFSAQSQILSIIKTILLIAFSFVAIKIVVLKGGGG